MQVEITVVVMVVVLYLECRSRYFYHGSRNVRGVGEACI